jgi:hypothetical protein
MHGKLKLFNRSNMEETNPIHTIPSYLSKIHFNIVHTYVLVFPDLAQNMDQWRALVNTVMNLRIP